MKKFKVLHFSLFLGLLVSSLAGCGTNPSSTQEPSSVAPTTSSTQEPSSVSPSSSDPSGSCVMHGYKTERTEEVNRIEPTCTENGSYEKVYICGLCHKEWRRDKIIIDAIGHDYHLDDDSTHGHEGVLKSTCVRCGDKQSKNLSNHHFENGVCTECGEYLVDLCQNDIGETYFAAYPNGANLVKLYSDVKKMLTSAYKDTSLSLTPFLVDYQSYNVTLAEAKAVAHRVQLDCPIFYFLSSVILESVEGPIGLAVNEEFASSEARIRIQNEIDKFVNDFDLEKVSTDPFDIVLMAHDYILNRVDYAYDNTGKASDEAFAHTIVGVLENGEVVCEGYSKAFQLLCDYYSVPCVIATGNGKGENHAWNMVELNDQWYWVDLTWDDVSLTTILPGFSNVLRNRFVDHYKYFLVGDEGFVDSHVLNRDEFSVNNPFMYRLPDRASAKYLDNNNTKLFSKFEEDGIVYQMIEDNAVTVAEINKTGNVSIPKQVEYNCIKYNVVAIGSYFTGDIVEQNNMFSYNDQSYFVTNKEIDTLTIPSSVKHIVELSLTSQWITYDFLKDGKNYDVQNHVKNFVVEEGNSSFCAKDGVLYTKDMLYLVAYPFDTEMVEYVMPSTISLCDEHALEGVFKNTKKVVFGKGFNVQHEEYPFIAYCGPFSITTKASAYLGLCGGSIDIDPENELLKVVDGVVYYNGCYLEQFVGPQPGTSTIVAFADTTKSKYHIVSSVDFNGQTLLVKWINISGFSGRMTDDLIFLDVSESPFKYLLSATEFDLDVDYLMYDGYCVYYGNSVLYCREDLENIVFTNTIDEIRWGTFMYAKMKSINIPVNVTRIDDQAFYFAPNLTDIYYDGTIEQWNNISFGENWDIWTHILTIHCSDGDFVNPKNPSGCLDE